MTRVDVNGTLRIVSWKEKAEVFEKSYDEVLLAIKHHDDKLNRTLTALAFLTTAGVTLFASVTSKLDVRFAESGRSVATFFFLTFLASVGAALVTALSAIGPSQPLPPLQRRGRSWKGLDSLIFFGSIKDDPTWDAYIDWSVGDLQERLARNFHGEALNLSHRLDYKMGRSRESGAFVQLAILSLSLLGIFSIEQITLSARWWIAAALLMAMLALPLWDLKQMRSFSFTSRTWAQDSYALIAVILACAGTLLFGAPVWDIHWWAIFYVMPAILATRLAYVNEGFASFCLLPAAVGGIAVLIAWVV